MKNLKEEQSKDENPYNVLIPKLMTFSEIVNPHKEKINNEKKDFLNTRISKVI